MLTIELNKNLRKRILQGHPWVYREALAKVPASKQDCKNAQLVKVLDSKKEFLGWAIYNPNGPLSLRMLSTEKSPPNLEFFQKRFQRAKKLRRSLLHEGAHSESQLPSSLTNCYRLFNGEGDGLPGLICDCYSGVAVVQFDGPGSAEFWNHPWLAEWLLAQPEIFTVVEKKRRPTKEKILHLLGGKNLTGEGGEDGDAGDAGKAVVQVQENGVKFLVDLDLGQKTGFFLDQRDNRQYVKSMAMGKTILNLFSYSGGFSVYAGLGGATHVTSLDMAQGALDLANKNWALNHLQPSFHTTICQDAFEFLESTNQTWDMVLVDPPSMAHSEDQKPAAIKKYVTAFAAAAKRVRKGGDLCLSSCSSHISFDDFSEIITQALSEARLVGQTIRISGQGGDHPFPHALPEFRYLKFVHLVVG